MSWSGARIHVDAGPVTSGATRNAPSACSAHARNSHARSTRAVADWKAIGVSFPWHSFLFCFAWAGLDCRSVAPG